MNKLKLPAQTLPITNEKIVITRKAKTANIKKDVKLHCFELFDELFDGSPDEYDQLNFVVEEFKAIYQKSFPAHKSQGILNYQRLDQLGIDKVKFILDKLSLKTINILSEVEYFIGKYIRQIFTHEIEDIFQIKKLWHEIQLADIDTQKAKGLAQIIQRNLSNTCLNIPLAHLQSLNFNNPKEIAVLIKDLKSYLSHIPYSIRSIKNQLSYPNLIIREYDLAKKIQQFYDLLNNENIFKERMVNLGTSKKDKKVFLEVCKENINKALDILNFHPEYIQWRLKINNLNEKSRILITELTKYESDLWTYAFDSNYQKSLVLI